MVSRGAKSGAELFNELSFNLLTHLECLPGVSELALENRGGCSLAEIDDWHRRHKPHTLPPDVVAFLRAFDGLRFSWRVDVVNRGNITVGQMRLHRISEIKETALDLDDGDDPFRCYPATPPKAFCLDHSESAGNVALVYRTPEAKQPQVWFQDMACSWHYVAPSFSAYFRLMIVHLGIVGWQYAYTDVGLDPSTKQWMRLYCPERLAADEAFFVENVRPPEKHPNDDHPASPTKRQARPRDPANNKAQPLSRKLL